MQTELKDEFKVSSGARTASDLSTVALVLPPRMVHLAGEEGWHLYFDPENHVWVRLNESGKEVIESLETHSRLDEVVSDLAGRHNLSGSEIRSQVSSFILNMIDARIVHVGEYSGQRLPLTLAADHPTGVYFSNTERCNLSCIYCYNAEGRASLGHTSEEMTTDETKEALLKLRKFGASIIAYCGGEPMSRPDFLETARYAKSIGFFLGLVTNGTMITEKNVREISETFDLVWVSFDSIVREEHEALRGKGSYARTLRGLRLLSKNKPKKFIVNSVVCRLNAGSVPATNKFMREEIGVDLHRMSAYMPTAGQVYDKNGNPIESIADDAEYRDILYNAGLKLELGGDELPPLEIDSRDGLIIKRGTRRIQCGFASGDIHMVSNGDIYPCVMMYKEEFKAGNIITGDIEKIYRESEPMKKCREATVDSIKECSGCLVKYICTGGCRATAYEKYGSLNAYHKDLCKVLRKSAVDSMWLDTRIPLDKMKPAIEEYKKKLREFDEKNSVKEEETGTKEGQYSAMNQEAL